MIARRRRIVKVIVRDYFAHIPITQPVPDFNTLTSHPELNIWTMKLIGLDSSMWPNIKARIALMSLIRFENGLYPTIVKVIIKVFCLKKTKEQTTLLA